MTELLSINNLQKRAVEIILNRSIIKHLFVPGTLLSFLLAGHVNAQEIPPSPDEFQSALIESEAKQANSELQWTLKSTLSAPAQDYYDVSYYRIQLDIHTADSTVAGTVTMNAVSRIIGLDTVVLDLGANMTVENVGADAGGYSRDGNLLKVGLTGVRNEDEPFTITITYHGQPVPGGLGTFAFNTQNGTPMVWSLSEPYGARIWWPCKDTPGDKADSVDIILTVPDSLTAVSNGALRSNVNNGNGTRTFHWHESYSISTYLVSLAITNYETYTDWFHHSPGDSMEVTLYYYPGTLDQPQTQLTELLGMLTYFHDVFGPYPFITEKYGIAEFEPGGGMEHQTITSQGTFLSTYLTAHELAHQWWGDKITNANWHEIWLNEGFASYGEAMYYEHIGGADVLRENMAAKDYQVRYGTDFPYPLYVDDTTSVGRLFHRTVYWRGAWFLHMLRHIVGDSVFADILLAYSDDPRFAYGNATTAGFQSVCESVAGTDLDWFFEPWVYHAGRPSYAVEWSAGDSAGIPWLALRIEQTQYPAQVLFPMPIDITIETALGDTTVTAFNDNASQDFFFFPLHAAPTAVILDQDNWILKYLASSSFVGDTETVPTRFALEQNYPNPFNASSHIEYSVYEASRVRLAIHDLLGREVVTLVNTTLDPKYYTATWDGRDKNGIPVASGVYFYRVEMRDSGPGGKINFAQTKKMVLLR
ncbi:MAG: T9SS type A sorting domain-containing protein [Fidelibacterota bacterium]|nr:MAG: T9SS type A sorting domain-containing protein [Candidatus Neomarinimicrobiota bacterium]